jgi:ABC-type nitrate/sulfonate/bicarbonate transport system ATPase subunit
LREIHLLRLIVGLDAPDSGELWVGSEPITAPSAERGLVFQDPNLFPWLTVRRNIEAGLVARNVLHEKRDEVDEFMRLVGLETFDKAYPHHLSGGMVHRAALARAHQSSQDPPPGRTARSAGCLYADAHAG